MGEILLCSHSSPLGETLLYSSFSGRGVGNSTMGEKLIYNTGTFIFLNVSIPMVKRQDY